MAYTIKEIEDALINTIRTNMTYLKTVKSYQGDFERDIKEVLMSFPCALVMFSERRPATRDYSEELIFSIIVADKSMAGDPKTGSTGTYKMLEDLRDTLYMQKAGLDIEPIELVSETALINTMTFSAYVADYKITQNVEDKIWK